MKRFMVSTRLRLPSTGMKIFFAAGITLACVSACGLLYSLIARSDRLLGPAIIAAIISFLWLFAVRAISESRFGGSIIGFDEDGILFQTSTNKYRLSWADCVECGVVRNRLAYWIYASDHRLGEKEKKNFPENVGKGVMYFNRQKQSLEEFMKFVPEKFKDELIAQREVRHG